MENSGNCSSVIHGSGTCSYMSNNLNQYTAVGTTSFQYDDDANMISDGHYTYDPENRLVKVENPNRREQTLTLAMDFWRTALPPKIDLRPL